MGLREFSRLAVKHARNAAAEELYLRGVADVTKPVTIYGILNERCNYRCRYCEFWRMKEYMDEMSIEEWKSALLSLKDFIGHYHIEFSGGEPFIKKGFFELIAWCRDNDIGWGVTTNGHALTPKQIPKIIDARPFNFNISMDSHTKEVHDHVRGREGSHDRLTEGLAGLLEAREKAGLDFPIIIKPVVHKLNFRFLPEIVEWVRNMGAASVNFQPVDRWTQETYDEMWIDTDEEKAELEVIVKKLLELKAGGAPILNSDEVLKAFGMHFREESAPPETMPCRIGMRDFFIRPNGEVEMCWSFKSIGNIKDKSAKELWYGEAGKSRRKETTSCEKLCLFTCLSQKTLGDKVRMGVTLLSQSNERFQKVSKHLPNFVKKSLPVLNG